MTQLSEIHIFTRFQENMVVVQDFPEFGLELSSLSFKDVSNGTSTNISMDQFCNIIERN